MTKHREKHNAGKYIIRWVARCRGQYGLSSFVLQLVRQKSATLNTAFSTIGTSMNSLIKVYSSDGDNDRHRKKAIFVYIYFISP